MRRRGGEQCSYSSGGSASGGGKELTTSAVIFTGVNPHGGADATLWRIIHLVREAQGTRRTIQPLPDWINAVVAPVVLLIAVATFVLWFAFGPAPRLINSLRLRPVRLAEP